MSAEAIGAAVCLLMFIVWMVSAAIDEHNHRKDRDANSTH
jgi:hypothetical protein